MIDCNRFVRISDLEEAEKIIEDNLPTVEEAAADLRIAWQASLNAEERFKSLLEKFIK